jgi:hypothetical protein
MEARTEDSDTATPVGAWLRHIGEVIDDLLKKAAASRREIAETPPECPAPLGGCVTADWRDVPGVRITESPTT